MDIKDLLDILNKEENKVAPKARNILQFSNFIELKESEHRVPVFQLYWLYIKWCRQTSVKRTRIVTKHVFIKELSKFYKKQYTYPKVKKYGTRVDYQTVFYISTPYLPLSQEEEEAAFKYYNFIYSKGRNEKKKQKIKI